MVYGTSIGPGTMHDMAFKHVGNGIIIEKGTRMFDTKNITIYDNVYIGHDCFIDGYHEGPGLEIGENSWIGPMCYINAAGGVKIGKNVGIGPCVKIFTSFHDMNQTGKPVIENELKMKPMVIEDNCDIGVGVILCPGAHVGEGCVVEAGVVLKNNFGGSKNRIIKNSGVYQSPHEVRRKH